TARVDDEADVEVAIFEFRVPRLGLSHHVRPVLVREVAQGFRLWPRDVDGALAREVHVVEVKDLVVEALECAFGDRDQPDREVETGQPGCGFDQVLEVLEICLDVLALPDSTHCRDETDGGVWAYHGVLPPSARFCTFRPLGKVALRAAGSQMCRGAPPPLAHQAKGASPSPPGRSWSHPLPRSPVSCTPGPRSISAPARRYSGNRSSGTVTSRQRPPDCASPVHQSTQAAPAGR